MTWKAKVPIYHDPLQKQYEQGDTVPDAVVKASPWLAEEGLVIDGKAKPEPQDAPAAPAADAVNPDDIEASPADEEG